MKKWCIKPKQKIQICLLYKGKKVERMDLNSDRKGSPDRNINSMVDMKFVDTYGVKSKIKRQQFDEPGDLGNVFKAYEIINAQQSRNLTIQNSLKSKISIFDHQIMAAKRVKFDFNGRVLLADEVGLGKTIEAGILLKEYFTTGMVHNALILTPPSLRTQWQEELNTKFELDFVTNKDKRRFKGYDSHSMLISSLSAAVQPRNANILKQIEWDLVVIDEAHRLKNESTKAHKFVADLQKKFIFLLSATPIQNNLRELYNLSELIRPGLLGSRGHFASTYTSDKKAQKIIPAKRAELQDMLKQVMIRTTRDEVRSYIQLTDRIPQTHMLPPTEDEIKLYNDATDFVRGLWNDAKIGRGPILPLMILQRQISSSSAALYGAIRSKRDRSLGHEEELEAILEQAERIKVDSKMRRLQEIIKGSPEDKFLIFTEFRDSQDYISDSLDALGIESVKFNGTMSAGDRDIAVRGFKRDIPIMVSTEAGGEGQNFQFCNRVINYDLPWNPMKVEQRVGRVHRIGQEEDVYIHNMAIEGSIEEYVLGMLFDKINLFKMTIGDMDLLFEDHGFERLPTEIFESYMDATTPTGRKNKFSAIGDRLVQNKRDMHDTIMMFDHKVLENFDLSAMKQDGR